MADAEPQLKGSYKDHPTAQEQPLPIWHNMYSMLKEKWFRINAFIQETQPNISSIILSGKKQEFFIIQCKFESIHRVRFQYCKKTKNKQKPPPDFPYLTHFSLWLLASARKFQAFDH